MDIKNEILWRIYTLMVLIVLGAVFIFGRAIHIQTVQGDKFRSMADSLYVDNRPIMADRGNIMAEDGSLLATSLPYFKVYMDTRADGLSEDTFNYYIDTLARALASMPGSNYTYGGYRDLLVTARTQNNRYLLIGKNITFPELERMKKFPLFNKGRYKGGFIVERMSKRQRPFRMLAHRTIGYVRPDAQPVGLEGAFNDVLQGEQGYQLMQRIPGNVWIPLTDLSQIEPRNGHDIVTTLDVNIQDAAGNALLAALKRHDAHHGCAIVMEVQTGAIKAIANIGKTRNGNYWETYNFAIGESTEPGSTFKLATIMALLEDGVISLEDTIALNRGRTQFYEETMVDASFHQIDSTTVRRAFEISSNVGLAQLVNQHYNRNEKGEAFIKRLQDMHLHEKTGVEVEGEAPPYIKAAYSESWSGTTLPWMAIGYEIQLTPLQMLTFYNAVANNGRMMRPYLVSKLQNYGKTYEEFTPKVIAKQIASKATIAQAQELLKGVVARGTASSIAPSHYTIAGKTGTAQIGYNKRNPSSSNRYQSSFAGYFPADNPKYSCIVVINDPKQAGFYGSEVAAPVFREIADHCYATAIDLHAPFNTPLAKNTKPQWRDLPDFNIGWATDFEALLPHIPLPAAQPASASTLTVTRADSIQLTLLERSTPPPGTIPNVVGMKLRDATYLLEKAGVRVRAQGVGTIVKQSIAPNSSAKRYRSITLTLR